MFSDWTWLMLGIVAVPISIIWFWLILGRFYRPVTSGPKEWPSVGVIIPAYNEEKCIRLCLEKLLTAICRYPNLNQVKVFVLDDGSSDDTVKVVYQFIREHRLHKCFVLVQSSHNRGRTHRLEQGFRLVQQYELEVVVTLDADTFVNPMALTELVRPLAVDPNLWGVEGHLVPLIDKSVSISLELLMRFYSWGWGCLIRRGQGVLQSVSILGNAFSAMRTVTLMELLPEITSAAGWEAGMDDSTIALTALRFGHDSFYQSTAVAQTQSANGGKNYLRQQARWQRLRRQKFLWLLRLLPNNFWFSVGMIGVEVLLLCSIKPVVAVFEKHWQLQDWRGGGGYRWIPKV